MDWLIPQFGFSAVGVLFLALLFLPNLLWTKCRPDGYDPKGENKLLLALERVGQVLVTVLLVCLRNLHFHPWTAWSGWLAAAGVLMLLYEGFWLRYFRGGHTLEDFYGSFCGVPVAGAALPVLAVLCLGLYGRSLWLLLAGVLLGIGHIGIHLRHKKDLFLEKAS